MTNAERGTGCGERDHERCPRCDPGLLDELKCQAEGIQKQAEYNAAHGQELDDARTAYNDGSCRLQRRPQRGRAACG